VNNFVVRNLVRTHVLDVSVIARLFPVVVASNAQGVVMSVSVGPI
jgi:hypothetical protein